MPALTLDRRDGVDTLTFDSPILSRSVLEELGRSLALLAASTPRPLVLASAHASIFLAGAHLGEIAELDPTSCITYAVLGRRTALAIASHPTPVVAAVQGSCSGGAFDLVAACDAIIASPDAVFRHPGVLRGLVTGWGGTESLGRAVEPMILRRALLEGCDLDAASLEELGLVRRLAAEPLSEARRTALELASLDPRRMAAWRHFKGARFIDRFRAFVIEKS